MNQSIPIKTPAEIEKMRQGGIILRKVLDELEKMVCPGISTFELDKTAEKIIHSFKGASPGFKGYRGYPASLCTSINAEVVHSIPHKKHILKEGDIIGIDCGIYYQGLYTDACRTVLVGKVSPEVQYFTKTTKKALKKAIKAVRPGGYIGDISAIIQKTIENQGYSPVIECTGHGIGHNLHEPPEILNAGRKNTGPIMQPGMILAIEPIANMGDGAVKTAKDNWTIITSDGSLSAHFEHTVLVTEEGYEILT